MMKEKNPKKSVKYRIGVDLLGADLSPHELLKAIIDFAKNIKDPLQLTLFATNEIFEKFPKILQEYPFISFHSVKETISTEEDPLSAIRQKKDSSIQEGIRQLKEKVIDAFVSAGNTGALTASASLALPFLLEISRPALLALFPTKKRPLVILDVGANIQCREKNYIQFAYLGAAYQKVRRIALPRVGLLNIGIEEKKGTTELRNAYRSLNEIASKKKCGFSFVGNVEGREIFEGKVDVLITDGFTGNVLLKTAEGLVSFILDFLKEQTIHFASLSFKNHLKTLEDHLHHTEYPGALFCGIDRILIKCHGHAQPHTICKGISEALRLIKSDFLKKIKKYLPKKL